MLENIKIMGISPHIVGFPHAGENRAALPGDSVFSTPDGITRTYPIHTLATYEVTPSYLRPPLVHKTAQELATDPSILPFFWSELTNTNITNPNLINAGNALGKELVPELQKAALERETSLITENQILTVFSALHPKSEEAAKLLLKPAEALWNGFMQGTLPPALRGLNLDSIKKRLDAGNIKMDVLQTVQDKVVHLMYELTLGVMRTHDTYLMEALLDVLSYRHPSFNYKTIQSGLSVAASFSLNDNTLAKQILIDFTKSLLEGKYNPGEYTTRKLVDEILEKNPTAKHYLKAQEKLKPIRNNDLVDFYENRFGKSDHTVDTDLSVTEYYTRTLPFPESLIYSSQNDLWAEYLRFFSDYAMENKIMKNPVELLYLPDGTIRQVATVDDDPFFAAQEIMRFVATQGGEISKPHEVETFLAYLRPKLQKETFTNLALNNAKKRLDLIMNPSHGLSTMGLTVVIDENNSPGIEAKRLSLDQSASEIDIQIGNSILHMNLDDHYRLVAKDGMPLNLTRETKIWWDHVILPQLHQYVCVEPEQNEGYMEGITLSGNESRQEVTRRTIIRKIGHFRKLGLKPGGGEKHHSPEQRNLVLERKYLLPKVERLDLDVWNKDSPFGEKVTFVLPVEKELTERPVFHLPHAYKDDDVILANEPSLKVAS